MIARGRLSRVLSARAPGKCIVFGEHAVVHGAPELLFAIDLYSQVTARSTEGPSTLNGSAETAENNPYLRAALQRLWPEGTGLALTSTSRIPRSAGLGSSAAFTGALSAVLRAARQDVEPANLAAVAFEIERSAQGVGSPGDTSAVVAGGFVALNAGVGEVLWEVGDLQRRWTVRRVTDPGWVWIVAYSGIPRSTGAAVRAVGERLARPDGPGILERFDAVAREGIAAVAAEDRERAGAAMAQNQELLRTVGVSHPRLEELLEAVGDSAVGAKLTGAGVGGSIVVLPRPGREADAVRRLSRAGAVAFAVRPARDGARLLGDGPSVA